MKRQSIQILLEEYSRSGRSQGKGAEVDISLVNSRNSQEVRESEGEGLGADPISLEAMVRTLAFPLSEMGASMVLSSGITGSGWI